MKKWMAEILAGIIPSKMERNRWRGILRYGLRNYFHLKRELKRDNTATRYNLGVCVIAKNEGPYLKEWIDWHRKKGVDKFYFYDNGSTDETEEILKPYISSGLVEHILYPGYRRQIAAYDDCIKRHRKDCRWLAFIDIDEFIVPLKEENITDFLKPFEDKASAVEINWLVFGSSGLEQKTDNPVMERFTRHSEGSHRLNRHVKSIVNPRKVCCMTGCHESARISGRAYDSHGNMITRNFREREPQQDIIRINHYAVKSREEFIEKQNRGRASGKKRNVPDEYFQMYDLNDLP